VEFEVAQSRKQQEIRSYRFINVSVTQWQADIQYKRERCAVLTLISTSWSISKTNKQ